MPSRAVALLGTGVATSNVPGVVSSQGCPDELPFLVWPQSTVRVEGTAFRISSGFGAAIYMCPLEGCPKQANGLEMHPCEFRMNGGGTACLFLIHLRAH